VRGVRRGRSPDGEDDRQGEEVQVPRLSVISDMDGVIYRGKQLIPGAQDFIDRMRARDVPFLFLTNNSEQTPLDLVRKLNAMGIHHLDEGNFITSAMAAAQFVASQKPGGSAYVVGGAGLATELHKVGYSLTESNPDYVVVGKTASFSFPMLKKAAQLIDDGAKFIGSNPDMIDPVEGGTEPAAGVLLAAIAAATGKQPYIVGKPNSLMMIYARRMLGVHAEDCVMVGDRMDTDIVGGMEAGMRTCLVLSGVTAEAAIERFPYRPTFVYPSVAEIDLDVLAGGT
jgi:NagD protein